MDLYLALRRLRTYGPLMEGDKPVPGTGQGGTREALQVLKLGPPGDAPCLLAAVGEAPQGPPAVLPVGQAPVY
jgi:hypothetical protein